MSATARVVGDRNDDGIQDIAVARRKLLQRNRELVSIEILDGADFESIRRFDVNLLEYGWGTWCLPGDLDLDGDGVQDLLLTSHYTFFDPDDPDGVSVHSGADLSLLYPLKSPFQHALRMDHFGIDGFSLNDVNRDGVPDIAVRAMNAYGPSKGYDSTVPGTNAPSSNRS